MSMGWSSSSTWAPNHLENLVRWTQLPPSGHHSSLLFFQRNGCFHNGERPPHILWCFWKCLWCCCIPQIRRPERPNRAEFCSSLFTSLLKNIFQFPDWHFVLHFLVPTSVQLLPTYITDRKTAQKDSFGEDFACLQSHKPLPPYSRLLCLTPELNSTSGLIHVGGHLRQNQQLESISIHPTVLNPAHNVTKLIFQDYDEGYTTLVQRDCLLKLIASSGFERARGSTQTSAKLRYMSEMESKTNHSQDVWFACCSPSDN